MRAFLRRQLEPLTRDDLFLRVFSGLVFVVPAALLTLLLRLIGVRGQRN